MAGRPMFNPRKPHKNSAFKIRVYPYEGKPYVLTYQLASEYHKARQLLATRVAAKEIKRFI